MKKLLAIVVLGLLWSGNAFAEKIPDMTNSMWVVKLGSGPGSNWKLSFKPNGDCTYGYWDLINRTFTECTWTQNGSKVVMLRRGKGFFNLMVSGYSGTGAYAGGSPEALKSVKATYIESWLTGSSNASSSASSTSVNDKIAQSKQICKDLGFKANNEKFADCALKMMSLQFEASDKKVATGGGTQQQIIIKEQQDYNIFDAMIDFSLLNSSINSAPKSNNTNCRVFKKHWGADLVCK